MGTHRHTDRTSARFLLPVLWVWVFAACGECRWSNAGTREQPRAGTPPRTVEPPVEAFPAPASARDVGGPLREPMALVGLVDGALLLRTSARPEGGSLLVAHRLNAHGAATGSGSVASVGVIPYSGVVLRATRTGDRVAVVYCGRSRGDRWVQYQLAWLRTDGVLIDQRRIARERPFYGEATLDPCTVGVAPVDDGIVLARGTSRLGTDSNAYTLEHYPTGVFRGRMLLTAREHFSISAYAVVERTNNEAFVATADESRTLTFRLTRVPLAGPSRRCRELPCADGHLADIESVVGAPFWTGDRLIYGGISVPDESPMGVTFDLTDNTGGDSSPLPAKVELRCDGDHPVVEVAIDAARHVLDPTARQGPASWTQVFWSLHVGDGDRPPHAAWTGTAFVVIRGDSLETVRCDHGRLFRRTQQGDEPRHGG